MCGIAGFLDAAQRSDTDTLVRLAEAMSPAVGHRGPDDAGVWVDAEAGVALSHRRLAVIDVSPAGHQPMVSRDERWVIVYNGELYDTEELRQALTQQGVPLCRTSDTEVLLEWV